MRRNRVERQHHFAHHIPELGWRLRCNAASPPAAICRERSPFFSAYVVARIVLAQLSG